MSGRRAESHECRPVEQSPSVAESRHSCCPECEQERQLFDDIQITYMTGKGNHVVPSLIPRACVHAMDLLCSPDVRRAVHVADTNNHIFANRVKSTHHVDGWHATSYAMKKAHVDSA